jgi:hypothetical protein
MPEFRTNDQKRFGKKTILWSEIDPDVAFDGKSPFEYFLDQAPLPFQSLKDGSEYKNDELHLIKENKIAYTTRKISAF